MLTFEVGWSIDWSSLNKKYKQDRKAIFEPRKLFYWYFVLKLSHSTDNFISTKTNRSSTIYIFKKIKRFSQQLFNEQSFLSLVFLVILCLLQCNDSGSSTNLFFVSRNKQEIPHLPLKEVKKFGTPWRYSHLGKENLWFFIIVKI